MELLLILMLSMLRGRHESESNGRKWIRKSVCVRKVNGNVKPSQGRTGIVVGCVTGGIIQVLL